LWPRLRPDGGVEAVILRLRLPPASVMSLVGAVVSMDAGSGVMVSFGVSV
jgi:hypothetical protein